MSIYLHSARPYSAPGVLRVLCDDSTYFNKWLAVEREFVNTRLDLIREASSSSSSSSSSSPFSSSSSAGAWVCNEHFQPRNATMLVQLLAYIKERFAHITQVNMNTYVRVCEPPMGICNAHTYTLCIFILTCTCVQVNCQWVFAEKMQIRLVELFVEQCREEWGEFTGSSQFSKRLSQFEASQSNPHAAHTTPRWFLTHEPLTGILNACVYLTQVRIMT
jgi:hypothetical protein